MSRVAYDLRCSQHTYARRRSQALSRPTLKIVVALMIVTASFAIYDLYLFVASGLH